MTLQNKEWLEILQKFISSENYQILEEKIKNERNSFNIFPQDENVYKSLELTPIQNVKVVIIGQDPYHEKGQANGLCFSVCKGTSLPPSLVNIYKEIEQSLGITMDYGNGDLSRWATQGVLLLNTTLTVREGQANSHSTYGWQSITCEIIKQINKNCEKVIFVLWGKNAESFTNLIDVERHYILVSSHPSPLSVYRGFAGCGHFRKINEILKSNNKKEIDWKI